MTGIRCPYCQGALALDKIGVHFQKFCPAIKSETDRDAALRKYNQFYSQLQSHHRGEITIDELQEEADRLFARK